jgi:electron transport complex protein RnfB
MVQTMSYGITDICNGCGACSKLCPVGAIQGNKGETHVINAVICIECGACGRICPVEAVQDQTGAVCVRVKKSQWQKPRFDYKKCVSCTICIDACPVRCLGVSWDSESKDSHGYPYMKNERACIGCGFCALECPLEAITMHVPEETSSAVNQELIVT